jgi:hypothetical protein
MEIDFAELMTKKSEQGLNEYITNIERYEPAAVNASIEELRKRGRNFTEEELESISIRIHNKETEEHKRGKDLGINPRWDQNKVADETAPMYYSQRTIWAFSIFFSLICGAALLASNTDNKEAKLTVIGFGIAYTVAAIFFLNLFPMNTGLIVGVNTAGAYILTSFFWNKYLGYDTSYRTKPILKPLIICLVIFIPLIALIIYGETQ